MDPVADCSMLYKHMQVVSYLFTAVCVSDLWNCAPVTHVLAALTNRYQRSVTNTTQHGGANLLCLIKTVKASLAPPQSW